MKRSFAMLMIVIGIIVVGVSVTKATKEFVSSDGAETAAIEGVEAASQNDSIEEKEYPEGRMIPETEGQVFDFSQEPQENAGRSRMLLEGAAEKETAEEEAAAEAVKSPLDPAVESSGPVLQTADEKILTAEDFRNRFAAAEEAAEKFGENKGTDSGTDQAAAEQEYVLWDYELNLIYGAVRERLSAEDADELKALELEWMRERDLYADKVLAANKGISAKSAEYLKRMTEKTKERCYWLAEQYGSVLDRGKLEEKE